MKKTSNRSAVDDTRIIQNKKEKGYQLEFTMQNVDVSVANGIRRTILSDIEIPVMKGFPHAESNIQIQKNTSRMNNEILKSRLGCIPIFFQHLPREQIENLQVVLKGKNNGSKIIYLTTESIRVKNHKTNTFLDDATVKKMFPPCPNTDMYIDILRLHPSILNYDVDPNSVSGDNSTVSDGEEVDLTANLVFGTSAETAMFNVTSTCAYAYSPDATKLAEAWKFEQEKNKDTDYHDWTYINKHKYNIPNSFDFVIETIGQYSNQELIVQACQILKKNLDDAVASLSDGTAVRIKPSSQIEKNTYDITIKDTYTLGKLFERELFRIYYRPENTILTFCGFLKNHPNDTTSTLRLTFAESKEQDFIVECFRTAAANLSQTLDKIILQIK